MSVSNNSRSIFDRVAEFIVTPGADGRKRRGDGSTFDKPERYNNGDMLPKNFGDEVRQQRDGSFQPFRSHEVVIGADGTVRPRYDNRPQRPPAGLPTNNETLGHDPRGGYGDGSPQKSEGLDSCRYLPQVGGLTLYRLLKWLGIIKPEPDPDFIDALFCRDLLRQTQQSNPGAVAAGTPKLRLPKLLP
jgi:hypothetical protein